MKLLFTSVLILSVAGSAFADHTDFVPKKSTAPAAAEATDSGQWPSRYPPYTRNAAHVPAKPAKQSDASKRPASRYPAYSRNNPHTQPTATPVSTAAGSNGQKRTEVSDK